MPAQALGLTLAPLLAVSAAPVAVELTVYSGDFDAVATLQPAPGGPGYALVRETFDASLAAGENALSRSGLPAAIDAAGARLVALESGLAVTSQRFDFALADQHELLRRALGRRVTVLQGDGSGQRSYTGTLLAAGDGLTLALDEGGVRVLARYDSFVLEQLPDGVQAQPTLRWTVRAPNAGHARFALDYPTGGLAWRAEYLATLSGKGDACRMTFEGAAQVVNRSGASFPDARLTLVAGQPNLQRSPGAAPPQPMMMMQSKAYAEDAPSPTPSGEYHAYALAGRTALPDGSVQRVPLLPPAAAVECTRRYEARSPLGLFRPAAPILEPGFGPSGDQPVMAVLEFENRREHGLGVPLPAGRLRVFERAGGAREALLGEAALGHTAAGRRVLAELGQVFDLGLERQREDLQLDPDRHGLSEAVRLTLRNARSEPATVRVFESLPRWSAWEVEEHDHAWRKHDAQTIAFDVAVPAGGEATVRYRVRYRWPDSITP